MTRGPLPGDPVELEECFIDEARDLLAAECADDDDAPDPSEADVIARAWALQHAADRKRDAEAYSVRVWGRGTGDYL